MYCVLALGINSKCFIVAMLSDTKHSFFLLYFEFIFWFHRREWKVAVTAAGVTATCLHCSCSFPKYVISGQLLPFPLPPSINLLQCFLFFFCFLNCCNVFWSSISKSTFFLFPNCSLISLSSLSPDRILIKTILSSGTNFPFWDVVKCLLLLQRQIRRTFLSWF